MMEHAAHAQLPDTMPVTDQLPTEIPRQPRTGRPPDDGTRALLEAGSWITLAAVLALIATETLFGGIGIDGPHTNAGWLAFMFTMMGLPFGLMLLALGLAKWLRNRSLRRSPGAAGSRS